MGRTYLGWFVISVLILMSFQGLLFAMTPEEAATKIQREYRFLRGERLRKIWCANSPRVCFPGATEDEVGLQLRGFVERLETLYRLEEKPVPLDGSGSASPSLTTPDGSWVRLRKNGEAHRYNLSSAIERVLGYEHVRRVAGRFGLDRIKVPKKYVWRDPSKTEVTIKASYSRIESLDYDVYAEEIPEGSRQITLEELQQLVTFFKYSRFCDWHLGNIRVAEDGIYILDVEFCSFSETHIDHSFNHLRKIGDHPMTPEASCWWQSFLAELSRHQAEYSESAVIQDRIVHGRTPRGRHRLTGVIPSSGKEFRFDLREIHKAGLGREP